MAEGLTERERFFRRIESLALSARSVTELPMVAAPPAHHDGVMVALVPDDPEQLTVEGEEALPADDLHITLCYLGKIQDLSHSDQTKILAKTRQVVDSVGRSFTTNADGVVVMGKNDDGVPATALLIQSDEIVELYDAMADALGYESNYPSFIPHMTTGYGVPVEDAQSKVGQPINFNKVIVKFGDAIHTLPLTSSLVAAPRSTNVIDRVIDSLGRLWDEALHPRDSEGRFIKKNGAVSGKLAVPTRDRKSVNMVDANRASVVGFHTFGDEVWVLAEITNEDGTTSQGFARAANVRSVAPVKARLDALYPVDERGDAFINSSLERKRQLDLLIGYIDAEYGNDANDEGAVAFLETLGLWEKDLDYLYGGDVHDNLGGLRRPGAPLSDEEMEEAEDIIEDARLVKSLRDKIKGLKVDVMAPQSQEASHPSVDELLDLAETDRAAFIAAIGGQHRIKGWPSWIYKKYNWNELDDDEKRNIVEVLQKNIGRTDYEAYRDLSRLSMRTGSDLHQVGDMVRDEQQKLINAVPVPVGHIRMYRGETPFRPTNKGEEKQAGSWWTTDFDYAHSYSRFQTGTDRLHPLAPPESRVLFVDIPEEEVRGGSRNRGGSLGEGGATSEFNLDFEWRERARTVDDLLAAEGDDELAVHTQPSQNLLQGNPPDEDVVNALSGGADPLTLQTENLLGAMKESGRFQTVTPNAVTGISPIEWMVDPSDSTGSNVGLAGTGQKTTSRAYFVKQSILGAQDNNTDIVNEVTASLISENVAAAIGDDDRLLKIPRSVFGDNPEWDGESPPEAFGFDMSKVHQPAHVVSQHAGYLIPADWDTTDAAAEEVALRNDIRSLDPASQDDQRDAFYEDIGNLYGNDITKMVLWDFVLLNGDRNPGNAILATSPDGAESTVIPIDHGLSFDAPPLNDSSIESTYEWFLNYQLTRAWLNYVRGGLNLDDRVSEASLRQVIQDFIDAYGRMNGEQIAAAFRGIPGVTDAQIERVEESVAGAVDRIAWVRDNMEDVLRGIVERDRPAAPRNAPLPREGVW